MWWIIDALPVVRLDVRAVAATNELENGVSTENMASGETEATHSHVDSSDILNQVELTFILAKASDCDPSGVDASQVLNVDVRRSWLEANTIISTVDITVLCTHQKGCGDNDGGRTVMRISSL